MAWFVVQGFDKTVKNDAELDLQLAARSRARPAHLARLQQLADENRVLAAGPLPRDADDLTQGFEGSLMIVEFDHRAALDQWLADEPYMIEGVYDSVNVMPFIRVLPNP